MILKNAENRASIKAVIFSLRVLECISAVRLSAYFLFKIFLRETQQRVNEINNVVNKI